MLTRKIKACFAKSVGDPVRTDLTEYRRFAGEIRRIDFSRAADQDLRRAYRSLKEEPQSEDARLRTSFALALEASRRGLGLESFDVQIVTGLVMAGRNIAELPTGEGKTLAAVFTACWLALSGKGVHVLTFNDYLARRDAAWMGPVYGQLGLSVGCVQQGMESEERRRAYAADITYATAKEAGFDFLRDAIVYDRKDRVHRPFAAALVDEADSILIDEARIPLIISGRGEAADWDARKVAALVKGLSPGPDYGTDAEHRNVYLNETGAARLEAWLGCGSLYDAENIALLEAVNCALHAEALLRRDVDYIVREGRIDIVDEFTGRVVDGRHWPDGIQAAVEAKEGIRREGGGRVLGQITLRHFFGLYPHLCGMTGTARSGAGELREFYGLGTVIVPSGNPCVRVDHPDAIFSGREAKMKALVREIRDVHATGRPILVGTASVGESEGLSRVLGASGINGLVLNARNDEAEAGIIAKAGTLGAVTISTNMAGRGTDIRLGAGDPVQYRRVAALGGLYVIGTNRHESLRIDRQLRGRAGRQGDPGSSRFFVSFDDDLFVRYGLREMLFKRHAAGSPETPIGDGGASRDILHAQRVIEGQNLDIRRSLNKYSDLVERQRAIVQAWRDDVLDGEGSAANDDGLPGIVRRNSPDAVAKVSGRAGLEAAGEIERRLVLREIDDAWSDHLAWVTDTRETIHLMNLGGKSPIDEFVKSATEMFLEIRPRVEENAVSAFEAVAREKDGRAVDPASVKGPSSTWTYLVNEDQFGWGMDLLKGGNIGFAALAAGPAGPLLMLWLFLRRLLRRRRQSL